MRFIDWGHVEYEEALQRQLELVAEVMVDPSAEAIVFCSHPPVVTLGRKAVPGDLCGWKGQTVPVQRGGKATYHGPGQLVAYPILHLSERQKDLYLLLRQMERSVIETIRSYGIGRVDGGESTGVWVAGRKIASIGVAVKRWVSYHGVAINLEKDPLAFTGISPCGYSAEIMTSLEDLLGKKVSRATFQKALQDNFSVFLSREAFRSSQSGPVASHAIGT